MTQPPAPPPPSRLSIAFVYSLGFVGPWVLLWWLAKHFDLLPQ